MGEMLRFTRDREARAITAEELVADLANLDPVPKHMLFADLGVIQVDEGDPCRLLVSSTAMRKCCPMRPDPAPRNLPQARKHVWDQAVQALRSMQITSLVLRSLEHAKPTAFPCTFTYAGLGQRVQMQARLVNDDGTRALAVATAEENMDKPPAKARSRKKK